MKLWLLQPRTIATEPITLVANSRLRRKLETTKVPLRHPIRYYIVF